MAGGVEAAVHVGEELAQALRAFAVCPLQISSVLCLDSLCSGGGRQEPRGCPPPLRTFTEPAATFSLGITGLE